MSGALRVVHYLNQFFGGIGGEEHANVPVETREGPVGPGRALQQILGEDAVIVATIIAGDNYFVEEEQESAVAVRDALEIHKPDVLVAGPAFDAGRYGLACAQICKLARDAGIPAVTAMTPDNTGITTYGREVIAVPTGTSPVEMLGILGKVASIALKLARHGEEALGPASGEGYMPRGIRRSVSRETSGAARAVDMFEARLRGSGFQSEVFIRQYDNVPPQPPITSLSERTIALVTSGGMVVKGNPDRLGSARAENFYRYDIEGLRELDVGKWESVHGGFNTFWLNTKDPNYALPLRAVRELESKGVFGKLHNIYYATTGNQTAVASAQRMGRQIAGELKEAGVEAVLLVAT